MIDPGGAGQQIEEESGLGGAYRKVADALKLRSAAEELTERAHHATATAAQVLVDQGLSYRDVVELLGISHQRVGQIMAQFGEGRDRVHA